MMLGSRGGRQRRNVLQGTWNWVLLMGLVLLAGCTTADGRVASTAAEPLQVMVLATMHGAHADNPRYSYDDVYALVNRFDPALVAVEIRAEDLSRGEAYLARNYPLEMRELARRHAGHVAGIDWLGEELEGRPVPPDYWREQSEIKRLERRLAQDSGMKSPETDDAKERQLAIVETATAQALNDGRYDRASADYYAAFARMVEGTDYQRLSDFYAERDRRIAGNAETLVADMLARNEQPARAVFVVGADHRGPLVAALQRRFGAAIELVPVP